MPNYETMQISILILSALISIGAGVASWKTSKKANNIAKEQNEIAKKQNELAEKQEKLATTQKKISQGQIELQIHDMISRTNKDLIEISLRVSNGDAEILNQAFNCAREMNLNAYDEACSIYLDDKIDKERFKKNYCTEIRQLVENETNNEKFHPIKSRYKCILKVYNEWNNLEKDK